MISVSDMLIELTKEKMEALFLRFLGEIFAHPEVISAAVKEVLITRETMEESRATAASVLSSSRSRLRKVLPMLQTSQRSTA